MKILTGLPFEAALDNLFAFDHPAAG